MITTEKTEIAVEAIINAPVDKVWQIWTDPRHIVHWNYASEDWHTPWAENDLKEGGRFSSRMESRDGSQGFDFWGEYTKILPQRLIEYTIGDGRKVRISFVQNGNITRVREVFEAEQTNPVEMQQSGWQAILDNFKKYVEESDKFEVMHFEIIINASAENVYRTMIDEKHFSDWTSEFNPSSRFTGSWEKGGKIKFLGTDKEGNTEGMVGRIKENIPNKLITIEYYGIIKNTEEITSGSDVENWVGGHETYSFREENGKTILSIDVDVIHSMVPYFEVTYPKALRRLKSICEGKR